MVRVIMLVGLLVGGCSNDGDGEEQSTFRSPTGPSAPTQSATWTVVPSSGSAFRVRDADLEFCSPTGCGSSIQIKWESDCSSTRVDKSELAFLGWNRSASCSNPSICGACGDLRVMDVQAQRRSGPASTVFSRIRYTRDSNGARESLSFRNLRELRPD